MRRRVDGAILYLFAQAGVAVQFPLRIQAFILNSCVKGFLDVCFVFKRSDLFGKGEECLRYHILDNIQSWHPFKTIRDQWISVSKNDETDPLRFPAQELPEYI